jgi:hypothetical protein
MVAMARKTKIPRARWTEQIVAAWRSSIEKVFECGRLLIAAKADLKAKRKHGEFEKMINHSLPFGPRTAERLIMIARDQRLTNPTHASLLPQSWMTLYALTRLSDDEFASAVADGIIKPGMTRRDLELWQEVRAVPDVAPVFAGRSFASASAAAAGISAPAAMSVSDLPELRITRPPADRVVTLTDGALADLHRRHDAALVLQALVDLARQRNANVETIIELLLDPRNEPKLDQVRRGLNFAIAVRGALDRHGLGGTGLRVITTD